MGCVVYELGCQTYDTIARAVVDCIYYFHDFYSCVMPRVGQIKKSRSYGIVRPDIGKPDSGTFKRDARPVYGIKLPHSSRHYPQEKRSGIPSPRAARNWPPACADRSPYAFQTVKP